MVSIDVLKYRYFTAALSTAILAVFIGVAVYKKVQHGSIFSYSVDFEGGTQVLLRASDKIDSAYARAALEAAGRRGVATRDFTGNEILIRIKESVADVKETAQQILQTVQGAYENVTFTILQSEVIGASVGEEMRYKSFMAILFGIIAMLLYIAIRFWSFAFGVGAVIALIHDAIVVLATFLILDREVSVGLIMAVLTVLGYSINDTIIIFSNIREQLAKNKNRSLNEIVTAGINQTLRRTILTSFATALAVFSMLLLGGEVLRDLSIALAVGIVFGTYSSIFIASPVMMLFYKEDEKKIG